MLNDTAIRARSLTFAYGDTPVLTGIDVDLQRGAVTAVTGPNGAGKSTLIEILAGVRRPRSGSIERTDPVALVVQRPSAPDALPLTVRDVVTMGTWRRGRADGRSEHRADGRVHGGGRLGRVHGGDLLGAGGGAAGGGASGGAGSGGARSGGALGRRRIRERVAEALERVELAELADRPFGALSGGQRQRALLAQGLVHGARILLLDEPAAGLDADSRDRTRLALAEEAARGVAVACVTHDPVSIEAADHVIRLGE